MPFWVAPLCLNVPVSLVPASCSTGPPSLDGAGVSAPKAEESPMPPSTAVSKIHCRCTASPLLKDSQYLWVNGAKAHPPVSLTGKVAHYVSSTQPANSIQPEKFDSQNGNLGNMEKWRAGFHRLTWWRPVNARKRAGPEDQVRRQFSRNFGGTNRASPAG